MNDHDAIGLSIDMLDADRVRDWARLLLTHGADIGHWASVPHLASRLQILGTGIEKTVRDVGSLRQQRDRLRSALVGLVGVDSREELEAMEAMLRLMPAPAEDKAATIDAIHALLATLGEPPSINAVDPSEGIQERGPRA